MCTYNYTQGEMGCRNGGLREEENDAMAASLTASDALLFATMCIVELPVDVHAKDGSIYTGIFYTARVDKDYAVVLKNARMIKKGNRASNVANGSMIETLIVQSEDLVQVVAKEVPIPSNEVSGYLRRDGLEAIAGTNECSEREAKANESSGDKKHRSETRFSASSENDFAYSFAADVESHSSRSTEEENERSDGTDFGKMEEAHIVSVGGRQIWDVSGEKQSNHRENPEFQDEKTTCEVQGSSLSLDVCQSQSTAAENILGEMDMQNMLKGLSSGSHAATMVKLDNQNQKRPTSEKTKSPDALSSSVSVAVTPTVIVSSGSNPSSSSASTPSVPPKGSNLNRAAKEFKLNPEAKIFSPSPLHHRSVTPPAVQAEASVTYMPEVYAMVPIATAENKDDISLFAPHSSLPVTFVPYNDVIIGNGSSDAPYAQPVVCQVLSTTQPIRYASQYHNLQAGTAYMYPNSQNVYSYCRTSGASCLCVSHFRHHSECGRIFSSSYRTSLNSTSNASSQVPRYKLYKFIVDH
ncbi:uncharacterized protein LOC111397339 isoform X2 [Olea europaea var. sylvestris]|uniref:uncharacterized protein LOC111397339 isoform X2 n=1 Tax=Olea europaea var. sylvestris TaxID=158386 RepID=UPI000C1D06D3|nr:uncharacterized protein LOC111397339 isoform X2 [Olea europaea var. sylvestris]